MDRTKADCDMEIAKLKGRIATLDAALSRAKEQHGHNGVNTLTEQGQYRSEIAYCKKQIYYLQAKKKSLKKTTSVDKDEGSPSFTKRVGRFFKRLVIVVIVIFVIYLITKYL